MSVRHRCITSSAQVQGVDVKSINTTSVQVSWTPISLPEIIGYRVVYSPSDYPCAEREVIVSGPPAVIDSLTFEHMYQFEVQALVEVGGETLKGERSTSSTVTLSAEMGGESVQCSALVAVHLVSCLRIA